MRHNIWWLRESSAYPYYIITQNFSLSGKEFVMKTNMGSVDRIIRIILAVRPDFSERLWVGNWLQPE